MINWKAFSKTQQINQTDSRFLKNWKSKLLTRQRLSKNKKRMTSKQRKSTIMECPSKRKKKKKIPGTKKCLRLIKLKCLRKLIFFILFRDQWFSTAWLRRLTSLTLSWTISCIFSLPYPEELGKSSIAQGSWSRGDPHNWLSIGGGMPSATVKVNKVKVE